jgi:hypothetical protein
MARMPSKSSMMRIWLRDRSGGGKARRFTAIPA